MTNSYNVQGNEKVPIILTLLSREGLQFMHYMTKSKKSAQPTNGKAPVSRNKPGPEGWKCRKQIKALKEATTDNKEFSAMKQYEQKRTIHFIEQNQNRISRSKIKQN